jgi:DNA-binding transcriptional ArsR family regulator
VETLSTVDVLARFGKALADPTRSSILMALRDGGAYPSDLAGSIGVSRQTLSNHLACLRDCGLVVAEPDGRRVRYELSDTRLAHALGDLLEVILAVEPICSCPVEECPAPNEECPAPNEECPAPNEECPA